MKRNTPVYRITACALGVMLAMSPALSVFASETVDILEEIPDENISELQINPASESDIPNDEIEISMEDESSGELPVADSELSPAEDEITVEEISEAAPGEDVSPEGSRDHEEETAEEEYPTGWMEVEDEIELETAVPDFSSELLYKRGSIPALMSSATEPLPAKYDPVSDESTTFLPDLRNQYLETCWAHSSIALAEIGILKNGTKTKNTDSSVTKDSLNLSELQLAYYSYNFVTDPLGGTEGDYNSYYFPSGSYKTGVFNRGGNLIFSSKVLAGWIGSALQDTDADKTQENIFAGIPASSLNNGADAPDPAMDYAYYADKYHLTDYYMTNYDDANETAMTDIKTMIRDYGAVSMAIYMQSAYYRDSSSEGPVYAYYNNYETGTTNHAITVVGWDDNYSKSNFRTEPAADGAWLVRNSWGSSNDGIWGYNGYFWLSYYDCGLLKGTKSSSPKVYAFVFDSADNFDNNYQYDGSMYDKTVNDTRSSDKVVRMANVFTAHANGENDEILKSVSFMTNTAGAGYTIDIYRDLAAPVTDPTSGTRVDAATTTGTVTYAGYHTIDLTTPVTLYAGEAFSVVVTLTGTNTYIIEGTKTEDSTGAKTWYQCTATAPEGTSFALFGNNSRWTDVGAYYHGNLRIKAFTDNVDSLSPTVSFDANADGETVGGIPESARVIVGEKYRFLGDIESPVRRGYIFAGWYTEPTGGTEITADTTVTEANDHTLYARWVEATITMTINLNPVNTDASLSEDTVDVILNSRVGYLPTPILAGYTFLGWFTDELGGNIVTSATVITDPGLTELYAHWKPEGSDSGVMPPVKGIDLSLSTCTIGLYRNSEDKLVGESVTISATVSPSTANQNLDWSISDPGIATIEKSDGQSAIVTAKAAGNATLYAKARDTGKKTATCKIIVRDDTMTIIPKQENVAVGKTTTMKAAYGKNTVSNSAFIWSVEKISGSGAVAAINSKGVLTALSEGQVYVCATGIATGKKYFTSKCINIYIPVKKAALNSKSVTIPAGASYDLNTIITPGATEADHATGKSIGSNLSDEVEWYLGNNADSFLEIDENTGVITAKDRNTSGAVKVYATFKPYNAKQTTLTCNVTVATKPLSRITLNKTSLKLDAGSGYDLTATLTPTVPADSGVTWVSSDATTVKVSDTGHIDALKAGTAVITATTKDIGKNGLHLTKSCRVTVLDAPSEITLNKSTVYLATNGNSTIKATVKAGSGTKSATQTVIWTSSNSSIAMVSNTGKVTALNPGTATITATAINTAGSSNPIAKQCTIIVYTPVSGFKTDKTTTTISASEMDVFTPYVTPTAASYFGTSDTVNGSPGTISWEILSGSGLTYAAAESSELSVASTAATKRYILNSAASFDTAPPTLTRGQSLVIKASDNALPGTVKLRATIYYGNGKKKTAICTVKIK